MMDFNYFLLTHDHLLDLLQTGHVRELKGHFLRFYSVSQYASKPSSLLIIAEFTSNDWDKDYC